MNLMRVREKLLPTLITGAAVLGFAVLYAGSQAEIEAPMKAATHDLDAWQCSDSSLNGLPLGEDKGIYVQDSGIYDIYLSVFPTKDDDGSMLQFSDFSRHTSMDHTYNPVLNCNIQILKEGKKPDPLLDLNNKNATIRVRGNSARGDAYKSYKVKLDEEAGTFYGQTILNINKHSSDITKVATKLLTDLLAGTDNIAGYRTYFMRLWIRDTSVPEEEQEFRYYGLYTETEQPNKSYLEARGLASNAVMYKARDFSFAPRRELRDVEDPAYDVYEFEQVLGLREASDHKKLLEMLEAVNDMTVDFEETFHTYFQEENYLTWLAFNLLMGNDDILNHNYILYSPENAKTWYFIPWDFDKALQFGEFEEQKDRPVSLKSIQKLNMCILHRRYFRLDGSIEKIGRKMKELLETSITRERVAALIDSYKPVLEKTMLSMPDLMLLDMAPSEMTDYLDGLYDNIVSNYETFQEAVQYPAPMFVAQPVQLESGGIEFSWEPSFSYQGEPVTYHLALFEDYNMERLVLQQSGIEETSWIYEGALAPGTYYLLVTAKDSRGNEQLSLEHVESPQQSEHWYYKDGLLEVMISNIL